MKFKVETTVAKSHVKQPTFINLFFGNHWRDFYTLKKIVLSVVKLKIHHLARNINEKYNSYAISPKNKIKFICETADVDASFSQKPIIYCKVLAEAK